MTDDVRKLLKKMTKWQIERGQVGAMPVDLIVSDARRHLESLLAENERHQWIELDMKESARLGKLNLRIDIDYATCMVKGVFYYCMLPSLPSHPTGED